MTHMSVRGYIGTDCTATTCERHASVLDVDLYSARLYFCPRLLHKDLLTDFILALAKRPLAFFKKRSRRNTTAVLESAQPAVAPKIGSVSFQTETPPMVPETSASPPSKANLKAWWNHFTFTQKLKKDNDAKGTSLLNTRRMTLPCLVSGEVVHTVFGTPLKESLKYASVQISTANANGDLYVWGYIPVVVAKWYVLPTHMQEKF